MANSANDRNGIDAILTALEELRGVVHQLSARVEALEKGSAASAAVLPDATRAAAPLPVPAREEAISDETITVIAAAVAAFLGKRAHVRQVRLISSSVWPQQGRAWVQASHRLER